MNARTALFTASITAAMLSNLHAGVTVRVSVSGTVAYNQIGPPPLGNFNPGDAATLTFCIDSDTFTNSPNFPTRGYDIDMSSFVLASGGTEVGLEDPFPSGQKPFFVVRDNDPAVDGFFTSTNLDFPLGVPLEQMGILSQFSNNFSVTYGGATLPSLDILDALGTYDFTGLQVFNWTVDDGPVMPLGIDFEEMTIECKPDAVETYCTAKTGLTCGTPAIGASGIPSATATSGFDVSAGPARANRGGVLLYTDAGRAALPFQGGLLCIDPSPLRRSASVTSGGNPGQCDGLFTIDMNAFAQGLLGGNPDAFLVVAGTTVYGQWWGRDSITTGSFLSDAVEYAICP